MNLMSNLGNEGGEASEDRKNDDDLAQLLRRHEAARNALARPLSVGASFQGRPSQPLLLQSLQNLRRGTGQLSGNSSLSVNPQQQSVGADHSSSLLAGLQAQALISNPLATSQWEVSFLQQQQQQQHLQQQQQQQQQQWNLHLLQQQQLNQIQQQQQDQQQQLHNQSLLSHLTRTGRQHAPFPILNQGFPASTSFNAQHQMGSLGTLEERVRSGRFNPTLSNLWLGNLPATPPISRSLQHLQLPSAPDILDVLSATSAVGEGNAPAAARMPHPQALEQAQSIEDNQREMNDADYFELFGFNDEDGIMTINETFPQKLYRMLFEVEKNGQQHIVSFFPHGKAFIVHQPKRFVEEVMPKYFSTSRMSSFQRQLNFYGFQRIDDGPEKGGFLHQYFQKGERSLCNKIKRQKKANASSAQHINQVGAGQGSAPIQMQRGVARASVSAAPAAATAASVPSRLNVPQSRQAEILLQQMLYQQQEESRNAGGHRKPK